MAKLIERYRLMLDCQTSLIEQTNLLIKFIGENDGKELTLTYSWDFQPLVCEPIEITDNGDRMGMVVKNVQFYVNDQPITVYLLYGDLAFNYGLSAIVDNKHYYIFDESANVVPALFYNHF